MKIDEKYNLIGDYPSYLDLANCSLDFEILMADPYANLLISDNESLEHIRIGNSFYWNHSVTILNCKKLKTIEIYDDGLECAAKWIECNNLPVLEKLIMRGDVLSLEIGKCENLSEINLDSCKKIAHVNCTSYNNLKKFSINGCIKLAHINGIPQEFLNIFHMDEQIKNNLADERELSAPLTDLTFKQVNDLLTALNKTLSCISPTYGDSEFSNYSINLLERGEWTYTGGTGEVYAYELYNGAGYGEHSPEDCLNHLMANVANICKIQGATPEAKINNTINYILETNSALSNETSKLSDLEVGSINQQVKTIKKALVPSDGRSIVNERSIAIPTFIPGCKVMHPKFGTGVILDRQGAGDDLRVQVEFTDVGTKWLALFVAKLTVIE